MDAKWYVFILLVICLFSVELWIQLLQRILKINDDIGFFTLLLLCLSSTLLFGFFSEIFKIPLDKVMSSKTRNLK